MKDPFYPKGSNQITKIIKAIKQFGEMGETPKEMFGRRAIIKSGSVTIDSDDLDIEFTVPFDDNTEANEAEMIVYNLSDTTIAELKNNQLITLTAGYNKDTGIIFSGRITKVKSKFVGMDKQTTIYALDYASLKERDVEEISFAAGTKAEYILKYLVKRLNLPIATFSVKRNPTFKDAETVSGGLMSAIKKYAEICGVSAYICKGKVYVRHLREYGGFKVEFEISPETGLIDTPEPFEEEQTLEDKVKAVVKGYKLKMLLQHNIYTGIGVMLNSKNGKGVYAVREGQHTFDGTNFTTEITVVANSSYTK